MWGNKKMYLVALVVALLLFGTAFSGCLDDDEENDVNDVDNGENDVENGLTGTSTYSGEWSGSTQHMDDVEGVWEFVVNFDEGTVSGWATGDMTGDVTGTVADGVIEASGQAGGSTVEWSGEFSADGSAVSGEWSFVIEGYGEGTWSGEIGETDDNDVDNGDDDNGFDNDISGTRTYSGTWEGTLGAFGHTEDYEGTWEYVVDFDEGDVTGYFAGDGAGDITGTVSDGEIQASGAAAFGTIIWSGVFSSCGEEISGTWEVSDDLPGSGTWSGDIIES